MQVETMPNPNVTKIMTIGVAAAVVTEVIAVTGATVVIAVAGVAVAEAVEAVVNEATVGEVCEYFFFDTQPTFIQNNILHNNQVLLASNIKNSHHSFLFLSLSHKDKCFQNN